MSHRYLMSYHEIPPTLAWLHTLKLNIRLFNQQQADECMYEENISMKIEKMKTSMNNELFCMTDLNGFQKRMKAITTTP